MAVDSVNAPKPTKRRDWMTLTVAVVAVLVSLGQCAMSQFSRAQDHTVSIDMMNGHQRADDIHFKAIEDRINRLENEISWLWQRYPLSHPRPPTSPE